MHGIPVISGYQTDPEQDETGRGRSETVRGTESRFESKPKKSENRPIAAAYQTHLILRSNISSRRGGRKNIHWYSKKLFDLSKDDRSTVPVRAKANFSAEFEIF